MNIIASVASALLLALALPNEFAPFGIAFVSFFALAPYFAAVIRSKSYKEAALLGAIFGSLSHAASSYWLFFFEDFAFWTIGSTSIAYGFLHIFVAIFLRRFSLGFNVFRKEKISINPVQNTLETQNILRPFLLALVWTLWEYHKSIGFFGYPWGLVAYGVNYYPQMIQITDTTGVYGLSFLLALSSSIIAEAGIRFRSLKKLHSPVYRSILVFMSIFIWFSVYGKIRLENPTPVVDRVPIILVQHNADSWETSELEALSKLVDLTRSALEEYEARHQGSKPALIVWSETVLRRPFQHYRMYFRDNPDHDPLIPLLKEFGVPLLTGAPEILDWDTYEATNSAILIDSNAEVLYSYAKQHPVPFAEAIPFSEYEWMQKLMDALVGFSDGWTMGTESVIMQIDTESGRQLRFGVPICFEDAFAYLNADFVRSGADILINITNDSWSKTVSAETQHLVVSRFRTVENRRTLIRATNSGVSAVIDAEGRILESLPLFTEDYLIADVPVQIQQTATIYSWLGDWLPLLGMLVLFLLLFLDVLKHKIAGNF